MPNRKYDNFKDEPFVDAKDVIEALNSLSIVIDKNDPKISDKRWTIAHELTAKIDDSTKDLNQKMLLVNAAIVHDFFDHRNFKPLMKLINFLGTYVKPVDEHNPEPMIKATSQSWLIAYRADIHEKICKAERDLERTLDEGSKLPQFGKP